MYVIRKISDVLLFYVDRTKTKKFWWSYSLSFVKEFETKEQAQKIADGFKYGEFEVITIYDAKALRRAEDRLHEEKEKEYFSDYRNFEDDHPFSSEALGQS